MQKYATEYRINKKGCECFRSRSLEQTQQKLKDLQAAHPKALYTVQTRSCPIDRYGVIFQNSLGQPMWGSWR